MNKFFKCFSFIILCGCEIYSLQLPSLDKQSFSYEQVMEQHDSLKEEIQKMSTKL